MEDFEDAVNADHHLSAAAASRELHYGRLEWLAEHIRRSDFNIHPLVARKILELLEGTSPGCLYQLQAIRRPGLPPRTRDKIEIDVRDFEMAVETARLGGFKRSGMKKAGPLLAAKYGLNADYIAKRVRPWAKFAQENLDE